MLDVLIKCNDKRAVADLFTKMKVTGYVDTISYNTLLKGMGAGATGLTDANMVLAEMRGLKLQPNQITYNSLINYAISTGDVSTAWGFVSRQQVELADSVRINCIAASDVRSVRNHQGSVSRAASESACLHVLPGRTWRRSACLWTTSRAPS